MSYNDYVALAAKMWVFGKSYIEGDLMKLSATALLMVFVFVVSGCKGKEGGGDQSAPQGVVKPDPRKGEFKPSPKKEW